MRSSTSPPFPNPASADPLPGAKSTNSFVLNEATRLIIEGKLGEKIEDPGLLSRAFDRSSPEARQAGQELEFLGDYALKAVVTYMILVRRFR